MVRFSPFRINSEPLSSTVWSRYTIALEFGKSVI
jgi:hypothetical protein